MKIERDVTFGPLDTRLKCIGKMRKATITHFALSTRLKVYRLSYLSDSNIKLKSKAKAWKVESFESTVAFSRDKKKFLGIGVVCVEDELSFHRFPSQQKSPERRAAWIKEFELSEESIIKNTRVCARHFPEGNAKNPPSMTIGKCFASPKKKGHRADRTRHRYEQK